MYLRQTTVEINRTGTALMFVNKSGNRVEAKDYNRHNFKEANNPSMRKSGPQSSKSHTASVQQRALQIMRATFPLDRGSQKIPNDNGYSRLSSGNGARTTTGGDRKQTGFPQKNNPLMALSLKKTCQNRISTAPPYGADEKALVKAKPKRTKIRQTSCRKRPPKMAEDNNENNDNNGVWFDCNVPFRVKIPFPIGTQNLFGMQPSAGRNIKDNTIFKKKSLVDANQRKESASPPAFPSLCISLIPSINQNSFIDQSASAHVVDLNETFGKTKRSAEKRGKAVRRSSVCENCTQTGYGMDPEALSSPLLSCLEQIRQSLCAKTEKSPKIMAPLPKCVYRYFAEKSTSVRSIDGTTVKDNAAAAAGGKKGKTPSRTQKTKPQNDFNNQAKERLQSTKKESRESNDPKNVMDSRARMRCQQGYRQRCQCCSRNMIFRRMRMCNACPHIYSPMFGHNSCASQPCGKLKAGESKRFSSDTGASGLSGSDETSQRSVSEKKNSLRFTVPNTLPGDCSLASCTADTTSDDERNSIIGTDRNGDRSQETLGSYMEKPILTEEELDSDCCTLSGTALESSDVIQLNSKENRISVSKRSRSQSAPAKITYRCVTLKKPTIKKNDIPNNDCGSTYTLTDQSSCGLCSGSANQSERILVGRQVSGRNQTPEIKICSNEAEEEQQQQPLVLVPFRLENRKSGKALAICQAKEWRNLTLANSTEVMPKKLRIALESSNRSTPSSSRVLTSSRPAARAVPRKSTRAPPIVGCERRPGQREPRAYPSAVRCPRHPNGPSLPNRSATRSTDVRNRSHKPAATWSNASTSSSCTPKALNIRKPSSGSSPKSKSPPDSQETLTMPAQCHRKPQGNKSDDPETVTLMPPRPLRSNGSLQSEGCEDHEASSMENSRTDDEPSCSDTDNQLQSGYESTSCHLRCQQYAAEPPMCNPDSSMRSFGGNQSPLMMGGMGFQQSCDYPPGLIDPRDFLPTMSAHSSALVQMSFEPNQMPMDGYQPQMPQSYQSEQTFHQAECHASSNPMYGSHYSFNSSDDLKESLRSMPVGFYEQTINKYKIDPLDSNFRLPALRSSFFEQFPQQPHQNQQQHQIHCISCPLANQSQQQHQQQHQHQSAAMYGHPNQHFRPQQQGSGCHCPYIMVQNAFPHQQQQPRKRSTQFKDFDQSEI